MTEFISLSRKKEAFEPRVPGEVCVYCCGPTAHARIHLGEKADKIRDELRLRGILVQDQN